MIQAMCVKKFRDNKGKIIGYRLQDNNGNTRGVKAEPLKKAIASNQIRIVNLTLTSDGRLIENKNTKNKNNTKCQTINSSSSNNNSGSNNKAKNMNRKMFGIAMSQKGFIDSIVNSYEQYRDKICVEEPFMVSFGCLWKLDTSLMESICIDLIKSDKNLNADFESSGHFCADDIILDMSKKESYKVLVKVIKKYKSDYQFDTLIEILANEFDIIV